jgi:hypothetical protein
MTQPRKEQVKNLKTKYTRFTNVGTLLIGGGPVQSVSNTVLEAFYDNFLSVTRTGAVGGAETSAPAILYGGLGPYFLTVGNSFTLTIAGLNGGSPMLVVLQAADFVTIDGNPKVTTSLMAERINQVVIGFGATVPVAANVSGQLILTSAASSGVTVGDSAIMTVTEVTAGILGVLGFTLVSSATATGTTAPKRGVVTVSADGAGGFVQLRKLDAAVSDALNSSMIHAMAGVSVPDTVHGQPTYARLTAFPGPVINGRNLKFAFSRKGPIRPHVVTSQGASKSNFTTLTGGDSVAVNLNFGNGQTLNFNVTFAAITNAQTVVDKFNVAFNAAALTASGVESSAPTVVMKSAAPYRSVSPSTQDSFFFSFNGLASIHYNPPAGHYSAEQLRDYINNQIVLAGQYGQGNAFIYIDPGGARFVAIKSLVSYTGTVSISPGNPGALTPGTFMGTLDALGLTPGTYRAGSVAELYGLDEVDIHCASPLPGAQLTISGSALTMAKLGLPSSVNVSTTVGVQAVTAPSSHALIPEMVEFHEESDDYDSVVQDFDNRSPINQLRPQDGVANIGLDQLIGPDGKIDASLIPRVLQSMGLDQLQLGSRMINSLTKSLLTPKISSSHDSSETGYANLLFESTVDTSNANANYVLRVYTFFDTIYITQNAKIVNTLGSASAFGRDSNGLDSSMLEFNGQDGIFKLSFWKSTDASTWGLSSWKTTVRLDSKGSGATEDIVRIGEFLNSNVAELLKPRVGLPVANILYALLFEFRGPEGAKVRFYARIGEDDEGDVTGRSWLYITVNAEWDGALFSKDVTGEAAFQISFSNQDFDILSQSTDNDTPWDDNDWEIENLHVTINGLGAAIGSGLSVGGYLYNEPTLPALNAFRFTDSGKMRTLLFQSDQAGPFANVPLRVYMLHGSSVFGQGYEFTVNARWEYSNQRWYADDWGQKSYSWIMAPDRFWFLSRDLIGSEWEESPITGWSYYSVHDHNPLYRGFTVLDGVFRVDGAGTTSNPTPGTAVRPNSVYAKSMIKSWGKIRGDGPGVSTQTILDGFNVSAATYDGGAGAFANYFATSMLNTHYAVSFSGRASNFATPPVEPGSYYVWSGSKLSTYSAALIGQATYGYSYYPLNATNGVPQAGLGTIIGYFMYFIVVGTQ